MFLIRINSEQRDMVVTEVEWVAMAAVMVVMAEATAEVMVVMEVAMGGME